MRVTARAAIVAAVAGALIVPAAGPTSAAIVPESRVYVVANGDVFDVCGLGRSASATNLWLLRVVGARYYDSFATNESTEARSTGTSQAAITYSASGSGQTFNVCTTIGMSNAPAGQFVVTLTYAGLGTDVAVTLVGEGTWIGSFANGSGTGIGNP